MCGKYEKVLDQHSEHQHVNIQEKSYKYKELGKMVHESSPCTPYNTSSTAENCNKYSYQDASIESSLIRHNSVHTGEELFKYKECGKCLCSNICPNQSIHDIKMEHKYTESDKLCGSTHRLVQQRTHSGEKAHNCGKCFRSCSSLSTHTAPAFLL